MRYAVIMAGGTGTRFWPESREDLPKQLLKLGSDKTLLALTLDRIAPLIPAEQALIVTGDVIVDKIAASAPSVPAQNLLSEPLRRNTAPCVALAAKVLHDRDPQAVITVLAADHLIQKEELFREIIDSAMTLAEKEDVLITLGIKPGYPETGYGYIEAGEEAGKVNDTPYHQVAAFHEKPDTATAQDYFDSGRFFWNSGMFVFKASALLAATEKHLPDLYQALQKVDGNDSPAQLKLSIDEMYPNLEAISIDIGIMEKAENIIVFPADIGWSDVGSWTTLRDLFPHDEQGNVAVGNHIFHQAESNTVFARDGIVVALGVEDLIIVHTPDATLVARRDDAQEVKKIYDELEKMGLDKYK